MEAKLIQKLLKCLKLVELCLPRDDAPAALKMTAKAASARNKSGDG